MKYSFAFHFEWREFFKLRDNQLDLLERPINYIYISNRTPLKVPDPPATLGLSTWLVGCPISGRGSWEGLVPLFVLQFAPSRTFSRTSTRRRTQGQQTQVAFNLATKPKFFPEEGRRTISESKNLPHGEQRGRPTKVGNKSWRNDLR